VLRDVHPGLAEPIPSDGEESRVVVHLDGALAVGAEPAPPDTRAGQVAEDVPLDAGAAGRSLPIAVPERPEELARPRQQRPVFVEAVVEVDAVDPVGLEEESADAVDLVVRPAEPQVRYLQVRGPGLRPRGRRAQVDVVGAVRDLGPTPVLPLES